MKHFLHILALFVLISFGQVESQNNFCQINIPTTTKISNSNIFKLGANTNPAGDIIEVGSNSMILNGKPITPVMGEIHFSRVKESEWKKELLKMRAGGLTIVATYVFWIHHEEIENEFDWSGQRDLRKFIQTCKELDFPLVLRIGPWCHGEVRDGGFPEWLVSSGIRLRDDNPAYLEHVKKWYSQVFKKAEGMLWKDGGPVIGIQLDNEYRGRGTHLMTLKNIALELGFDVPIYTRTGWPKLATPVPYGEIIPLYGDYVDGFWDRNLTDMPGDYKKAFQFRSFRNSTVIATEQLPKQDDKDNPNDLGYPFFTCELGGGMMTSYHRRINIHPQDIYSLALIKVGSGSNLPGYYMYHGGNNPDGKLTTLSENQGTSFTNHNDLPVETYDFQAPLGEFGQINPHYHMLRKLHLFLQDFGEELALMSPHFPEDGEMNPENDSKVRWSVRSNGKSGYVFVNNYERMKTLSAKPDTKFQLNLPDERIEFPTTPITIPSGKSFYFPFNLSLNGVLLHYATAQPISIIEESGVSTYVFSQIDGIPAEFVFDKNVVVESISGNSKMVGNQIVLDELSTGTSPVIQLKNAGNMQINIVLLDERTSLNLWKGEFNGKQRLFLTNNGLTIEKNKIELEGSEWKFEVSVFPSPKLVKFNGRNVRSTSNGIFTRYKVQKSKNKSIKVGFSKIKNVEQPLRTISLGSRGVAAMPNDEDFNKASVWKITLPKNPDNLRNITLRFAYKGDVARFYSGEKLLTDNFYNGKPFDVNLKYFADEISGRELALKILPLPKNDLIYFQKEAGVSYENGDFLIEEPTVSVLENSTVELVGME